MVPVFMGNIHRETMDSHRDHSTSMGTPLTRTKKENSTNDFEHRGRKHREVARPVQTSHSAKRSRKDWRREKDESRRYTRNLRHIESALDDTVTARKFLANIASSAS